MFRKVFHLILPVLALLTGCDSDCENTKRMDGVWAMWHQVGNSPDAGGDSPLTLSADYPTEQLFVNGWSRWKFTRQAASNAVALDVIEVSEKTDIPGVNRMLSDSSFSGSYTENSDNCNMFDINIKDGYVASAVDDNQVSLGSYTHTFEYEAHLLFVGDHIQGSFTYADTFEGQDGGGFPASGEISGVTGTVIATLQTDSTFDTGF